MTTGFTIWFTGLSGAGKSTISAIVEQALRALIHPDKINLAALGNQVPHLHWHVIPRFADDAHFPDPIWVARKRDGRNRSVDGEALIRELARRLPEIENA